MISFMFSFRLDSKLTRSVDSFPDIVKPLSPAWPRFSKGNCSPFPHVYARRLRTIVSPNIRE